MHLHSRHLHAIGRLANLNIHPEVTLTFYLQIL